VVSEPVNCKSRVKVILEPHGSIGYTLGWIGDQGPIGSINKLFYPVPLVTLRFGFLTKVPMVSSPYLGLLTNDSKATVSVL
jgi:hypothetical protein